MMPPIGLGRVAVSVALAGLLTGALALPVGSDPRPDEANPAPHGRAFVVAVQGDSLTLRATDVPLRRLLRRIARLAGVTLSIEAPLDRLVTIDLEGVPLDEGLRRLLREDNFVLIYAPTPSGSRLAEISIQAVGSEGLARSAAPAPRVVAGPVGGPPARGGSTTAPSGGAPGAGSAETQIEDLVQRALGASDPTARREAIEELGDDHGPRAVQAIVAALNDGDRLVRRTALDALRDLAAGEVHDFSLEAIKHLAEWDPDPGVRISALGVLASRAADEAERDVARQGLEDARRDPDPRVREHGAVFLQGLAKLPPTPPPRSD